MEDALGDFLLVDDGFSGVICVRVQGLVGHHMVFKQCLQVFLAIGAEEESIDFWAKFLESEVRWSEQGSAIVVRSIIDSWKQSGLGETKLQGAEFARQECNDFRNLGRRYQQAINGVNDTVGSKLCVVRGSVGADLGQITYDVNSNDAAVEVDSQALHTDIGAQPLRANAQGIDSQSGRHCMCDQNLSSWVELGGDMVQ